MDIIYLFQNGRESNQQVNCLPKKRQNHLLLPGKDKVTSPKSTKAIFAARTRHWMAIACSQYKLFGYDWLRNGERVGGSLEYFRQRINGVGRTEDGQI